MSQSESEAFPQYLLGRLSLKKGAPLTDVRSTFNQHDIEFSFVLDEGLDVLRSKFRRLIQDFPAVTWPDEDIYYKQTTSTPQSRYTKLTEDNYDSSIKRTWRYAPNRSQGRNEEFRFDFFIYSTGLPIRSNRTTPQGSSQTRSRAPASQTVRRATQSRIARSAVRIREWEDLNGSVPLGNISRRHLATHLARQEDMNDITVPNTNTFRQMMHLDQMQDELNAYRGTINQSRREIFIFINGVRVPVDVDLCSLRQALGLPHHELLASGIFNQPPTEDGLDPENPDQLDIDHEEAPGPHALNEREEDELGAPTYSPLTSPTH